MGYSPWGRRVGHDLATKPQTFGCDHPGLTPTISLDCAGSPPVMEQVVTDIAPVIMNT